MIKLQTTVQQYQYTLQQQQSPLLHSHSCLYFLAVYILRLLTFIMEVRVHAAQNTCWTYKILLLIKLPDDGTLVPKHVAPDMKCAL